jgi:endogenous inhibitor of DNA gyrase (YacG/DUF329 family)
MQLNLVKIKCPVCKKLHQDNDKYFPFCSSRCRLVDFGGWLDEEYRISEPVRDEINEKKIASE